MNVSFERDTDKIVLRDASMGILVELSMTIEEAKELAFKLIRVVGEHDE
jgi:hypothetical protein